MKNNHYKVLKRFGVAVIALGFLGTNFAFAADPIDAGSDDGMQPKEGITISELHALSPDLQINKNGLDLSLAGSIPKRCVDSSTAMSFLGAKGGKQMISIQVSADCEKDPKRHGGEPLISLSRVFQSVALADASGTVTLESKDAGPEGLKSRNHSDALVGTDDGAAEIKIVSRKDQAAQDRAQQISDLAKDADRLCKAGDFASLGTEISGAADLLGDVSGLLDKVNDAQQAQFKDQMASAKSAAEAKAVLQKYSDAAAANGWDANALNEAYIDARFSLIAQMADDLKSDKEMKQSSVDKAITDWQRELRLMDRATYRKSLDKFSEAYGNVALVLAGQKNFVAAAEEYAKAKDFATSDAVKTKFDGQITKAYVAAYKACLTKDPSKAATCDKNYASKAKAAADEMKDSLAQNAGDSDDASSEYSDFMSQYAQTFGQGPSYTFAGYGNSNPYAPGLLEQYKQQSIMNYQQQQQAQMYSNMMGGGMNRVPSSGGTNSLF